MTNEEFMKAALEEADIAEKLDEVPVGAVVVKGGEIISRAHNLREHLNQAGAHAERLAMEEASKKLGTWCLKDCDLYVTLEPCMMCSGTIVLSRIHHVYYGTSDPKGGCVEELLLNPSFKKINHRPEVTGGILQEECSQKLSRFFQKKRDQKKMLKAYK